MNKIALVTGGSRGLGKDMVKALTAKGHDVIFTYRSSKDDAENLMDELNTRHNKVRSIKLDISSFHLLDGFIEELKNILQAEWQTKTLDYLVNNAGAGEIGPIEKVTEDMFDRMVDTNFKGVFFLTQKMLPMINDEGGIVFISTGTTRFTIPTYSLYAAVKTAVEKFSMYVAKEYGRHGIRANVVAPGPVETDMLSKAFKQDPELKPFLSSQTSLGRVGQPDDIGSVVAFLCTDEAKWVNAQRIEVSGGMMI